MEQAIGERGFKREDRENFFRFIPGEGFSDEKMQLRAVESCRERLEKTRERLEREGAEKSRIAVGLGAISGSVADTGSLVAFLTGRNVRKYGS